MISRGGGRGGHRGKGGGQDAEDPWLRAGHGAIREKERKEKEKSEKISTAIFFFFFLSFSFLIFFFRLIVRILEGEKGE